MLSDLRIWDRSGPDAEAWIRERRPDIFRLALSLTASSDAAEDVTQEVCCRWLRHRVRVREFDHPWAWLRTVTVRCAIDILGRRPTSALKDDLPVASPNIDEAIAVAQTLARLTPDYRVILALNLYQQLSYEEIAEILTIPVGSVASRLHHAKARFRAIWEESC